QLVRVRQAFFRSHRTTVPLDRSLQAGLEARSRLESEVLFSAHSIEYSPRLPRGPARVPQDLPFESGEARDQFDQILDRDLHARSEIHRLIALVPLSREDDPLGRIGHVEKLASGFASAPHRDGILISFDRIHTLLDQRWNDMRGRWIEVIPWPIDVHRQEVDRVEARL